MYYCVGVFLTALKICKSPTVRQKVLGEAVFRSLTQTFYYGGDDSAISAVFRGKRNINSYLQIMMDEIDIIKIVENFDKWVVPLLDENKYSLLVRLLQKVVEKDSIDEDTHVELVNMIKKKDLIQMDEIVLCEFLAGLLLYAVKNTDNLNKEMEVMLFKSYVKEMEVASLRRVTFIEQYSQSGIFHDEMFRPILTLFKQSGTIFDVVSADLFEICQSHKSVSRRIIVIPVNTTFETKYEERTGEMFWPLVSQNTIHGKWLKMICKKGMSLSEIDKIIQNNLKMNGVHKCGISASCIGKQDIYPVGTIAKVDVADNTYYLLAISKFDKDNRAVSEIRYIEKALESLIEYYDRDGQGNDIYIPLLGAGRSRTGMTTKESFNFIKGKLFEHKNDIYGRIHIVIYPEALEEIELGV